MVTDMAFHLKVFPKLGVDNTDKEVQMVAANMTSDAVVVEKAAKMSTFWMASL